MGKRVTIVDVAAHAGVALSSASSALNGRPGVSDTTRERVRRSADELGYVPSLHAKSLSAKRSFSIGLVVQRDAEALERDPFFGAFIGGIEEAIGPRGYALVLQLAFGDDEAESRLRDLAANQRVDGVLIDELKTDDPRVPLVQELRLPAVGIVPDLDSFPIPAVRHGGTRGIEELVAHLVSEGHRDIAHVSGTPGYVHAEERERTWRSSLERAGLGPDRLYPGDFTYDGGRRAAERILADGPLPTAVLCGNDLSAVGLMIRMQEHGLRIPQDLSVCGFDGIALGTYVRPTLTTVRTSPRRVGHAAASLLLETLDAPEETAARIVDVPPGTLVVRDSTGPAPARD